MSDKVVSLLGNETPVHDELCERAVIGHLLNYVGSYMTVADILSEDCFVSPLTRGVYDAIKHLDRNGETIDVISVIAELAREGSTIQPYDVTTLSSEGMCHDFERRAVRLKELSLRRRLWNLGMRLVQSGIAETEDVEEIQQHATEELNGLFGNISGVFTLTDALMRLSEIITNNLTKGSRVTGTPTGFVRLDEKGGLHPSDLIIIGGESSHGKSSLLMSILKNVAEHGERASVYSLEMTKEQLAARLVSMKTGIPASDIMYKGDLSPQELEMIDAAKGMLPGEYLFFDDESTSNIDTILLSIRKMKMKYDIKGAAVDYLQILSVNSKTANTREQQMGDAARRLKNLAKELGIWIIALSQLSRNSQEPEPTLNRLRDSGQIAEAADVVIFVYRPSLKGLTFSHPFEDVPEEEVENKAQIDVAKGRNIGVFKFLANFNASTTHFTDLKDERYGNFTPVEEDAPF